MLNNNWIYSYQLKTSVVIYYMKIAVVVFVLLIIIGFIPFQQHANINIRSNYFDVCQQFISPDNWKHWQSDIRKGFDYDSDKQSKSVTYGLGFLINIPGQVFKVENISANTFKVTRTVNHIDHQYIYTVIPGIMGNNTTVIIDVKNNVGKWLFSKFDSSGNISDIPQELKSFMENAKLYYGFNINEKNIDERYLAVKKATIPTKNKYPEMMKATKELHNFIIQNNIKVLPGLFSVVYPQKTDSLQLLVGIPVDKQLNSTGSIIFMHMPGGKVLVGDYRGKYSERQQLYNAMEKYLHDHTLQKQVAPFEKYLDNKIPTGDNDMVNMQLNYPVL